MNENDRPPGPRRRIVAAVPALLAAPLLVLAGRVAQAHGSSHGAPAPAAAPEQKPWGIAGDPQQVRRTLEVTLRDTMRFEPDRITVKLGETWRLRVRNAGAVLHEFVIGTPEDNRQHAELMMKFPDMQHDEPWMAHVPPGGTGEVVWLFNRPGQFEFACLIAGHYQAGMTGLITVVSDDGAMTEAEVRKVDLDTGRVTLRHGEIAHLQMPPMTMVFRAREPALLQGLKPGDRVRFRAEKVEGGYAVTAITPLATAP